MNFKFNKIISNIINILICEVIIFGNGKWSEYYFGFNLRKTLFVFLILFLLIYLYKYNLNKRFLQLISIPAGAFLLWALVVPFANGISLYHSISEGSIMIGFLILPLIVKFYLINKNLWELNKKWILLSLIILSLSHIILALALTNLFPGSELILDFYSNILNPAKDSSLNLNNTDSEIRVGWISSVFLLMMAVSPFLFNMNNVIKLLIVLITILALYFNGQRGIYFAALYSGLCATFLYFIIKNNVRILIKYFFSISVILAVIIIFFASNPIFLEYIGFSRPLSDDIRFSQSSILLNEFSQHSLIGKGFGSTSQEIDRPEASPYSFEQFLLSMLMKTGLLGVLAFILYNIIWQSCLEKRSVFSLNSDEIKKYCTLFFLITFIFCASTSNPYLFNFVGIVYIYIVTVEYLVLLEKK